MKFTATQIAGILEGKVEGNPDAEVWNVAKIEEGTPGMISFLANPDAFAVGSILAKRCVRTHGRLLRYIKYGL